MLFRSWVMLGLVGKGVRARDVLPAVRLQPEAGGEAFGSPAVNQSVGSTSWKTTRTAVAGDPRCATAASVTARAKAAFCSWLRPARTLAWISGLVPASTWKPQRPSVSISLDTKAGAASALAAVARPARPK